MFDSVSLCQLRSPDTQKSCGLAWQFSLDERAPFSYPSLRLVYCVILVLTEMSFLCTFGQLLHHLRTEPLSHYNVM